MKITTKKLLSLALFVSLAISSNVMAADKKAAQSAIDKAETSRQHAASVDGEWRDTGKLIKKAKAALKEGQFDKAIKLAGKAERQGSYGYEQSVSQRAQKDLTSPSYLNSGAVSTSVVMGEGYITSKIKEIDVIHNGKTVTITRTTDKKATIPTAFNHTARACPPFCVQPITVAKNVGTIGELEVLHYLKRASRGDNSVLVVDSRTPEWVQQGTIPGSVSIPWNKISVAEQGAFAAESETEILDDILSKNFGVRIADGKRDFRNAKTLVMYCNGSWCAQSSTNIKTLISLGYPAYKLKWYRGGMQSWVSVGLSTIKP
ncbi:MAG: rhodanese-like domain-containing protein [Gammaproteobacteria bacterium]|nr:rhodanese-like domain-containing protein [Gammaproteobacteria bacterium]